MKYVEEVKLKRGGETLEVYECSCGCLVGLDASYIEGHGYIDAECTSCGTGLYVYDNDKCKEIDHARQIR